jgi:hypothetical protein
MGFERMMMMEARTGWMAPIPRLAQIADPGGDRDAGYEVMQGAIGHHDRVPLDASDSVEDKRFARLWYGEHHGSTVVPHHDADERTTIVTILGQ